MIRRCRRTVAPYIYTPWNSARSKPAFGKGLFAVGIDG